MKKEQSQEILKEMRRLYEEEALNLRDVGKRFGVTYQAVHDRFTRAEVPLRPNGMAKRPLDRETLANLYEKEELNIKETAKRLNISPEKVSDELERLGIKKRSGSYAQRRQPELYQLQLGERVIIKRPQVKNFYISLLKKARRIGIQISIKSIDQETLQIYRKK
jgi:predicted DNA-binding protein YlxM (UPF0122 family)